MVGILNLARQRNAPQFGALKLAGGAQAPVPKLPPGPGLPGPALPLTEAPDQGQIKGLLSRFLSAPGQGQALGLLGSYLMAAGSPTTDPGARTRMLAEGLREYAQTLRVGRKDEYEMGRQRAEDEREAEQRKRQAAWAASLPPEQQALAGAFPGKVAGQAAERLFAQPDVPAGFAGGAEGLAPIPGGPADPDYLKRAAGAKREPRTPPTGMRYGEAGQLELIPGYVPGRQAITEAERAPVAQYSGEVYLDEQVGKFYQVNPKTGKREHISPNEEYLIETLPGGGFRLRKGPDTGGGGLTTKTRSGVQEKLIDAREGLVRLRQIAVKFKPEFQEIPTRLGAAWTSLRARFGAGDISVEDRRLLTDFADYRRSAISNINLYIKEITGAQMSEAEADRLRLGVPDPGEGIFGGDDPISFETKMQSAIDEAQKALVRYRHYAEKGIMNVEEMAVRTPLDAIEIAVNEKTGEQMALIENEWVPF